MLTVLCDGDGAGFLQQIRKWVDEGVKVRNRLIAQLGIPIAAKSEL
jgi:hypothetical protein